MNFSQVFMNEAAQITQLINCADMEMLVQELSNLRTTQGRLFILGVGGSAANAAHAVNDFRKLCGIEAYAPTDNVSELTARTNDEGWETIFSEWLRVSHLRKNDALFIFSVGGGNVDKNVSVNLIKAIDVAKDCGAKVLGIVGRDGGYTKQEGHCVVVIPTIHSERVTPHTEAFHAVVWHCLVSHPILQIRPTKW